ncbi:ParB/RepB/Spo0J family partition protein [Caminibacter sp.]
MNELKKILEKRKKEGTVNTIMQKQLRGDFKEIQEIPLNKLLENPYQPRIEIKADEVRELANSIKEQGLIQPILVTKAEDGYYIIAGHRRVEAHRLLGKDKIRAYIIKADKNKLASIAIVENLQREDLDLIETALALKRYKEEFNKTLDEIGKEIGKTKGYVSQILNVLNLPEEIIKDIKENKSTKDVTALNWLNSYAKKKFSMLNKPQNPHKIEENEEFKKGKNEIIELYQGFLKYGRGWLKNEIDKRLKALKKQKAPEIKMEIGKRKTKIEINIPLTQEAIEKLKMLIKEFAEEFKVDEIKVKDNKYLKKQKHVKKEEPVREDKKEVGINYETADKAFKEIEDLVKTKQ